MNTGILKSQSLIQPSNIIVWKQAKHGSLQPWNKYITAVESEFGILFHDIPGCGNPQENWSRMEYLRRTMAGKSWVSTMHAVQVSLQMVTSQIWLKYGFKMVQPAFLVVAHGYPCSCCCFKSTCNALLNFLLSLSNLCCGALQMAKVI